MSKRIKYRKKGNKLESIKRYKGHRDAYYKVRLDLDNMSYEIKNCHQKRIIKTGGPYKNLTYLKRVAKRALQKLGVKFDLEIRNVDRGAS